MPRIIAPAPCYPVAEYTALTCVTKDSGLADALSTALFCMDYEQSRGLVDSLDGVEACWFFADGEYRETDGFAKLIVEK